jgi:hypothetical protein
MSRARSPSPLLDVKEPLCKEDKEDKDTSPNVVAVEPSLPGEVVLSLCRSQSLARDPSVRGDEPVDILTPAPNEQDFGPPPDGGTEAWRVVAASLLLLFAVFGLSELWSWHSARTARACTELN